MKKIFLSVLLLTGLTAAGFAQERGERERRTGRAQRNPEEMVQRRVDTLASRLNLNEEQKEEVYAMNMDRVKARQAWRDEYNDALKERMRKYREAAKADEEKMKKVLTEEQYQQYQEMKKEDRTKVRQRRGRFRKHRGDRPRKEFRRQKPDTGETGDQ